MPAAGGRQVLKESFVKKASLLRRELGRIAIHYTSVSEVVDCIGVARMLMRTW